MDKIAFLNKLTSREFIPLERLEVSILGKGHLNCLIQALTESARRGIVNTGFGGYDF